MEKQNKVIFLDIDGPMIPVKSYMLPGHTSSAARTFDPCATAMLNRLLDQAGAQIVISSTHGQRGYDHCVELLRINGVDPAALHEDWITPRKMSSYRIHEINWWLDKHPETTHYVAIDDESLDVEWVANSVQCDGYEGFSFRNYLECCVYLECVEDAKLDEHRRMIQYLKRREIWRTKRYNEDGSWKVHHFAEEMFPMPEEFKPRVRMPCR